MVSMVESRGQFRRVAASDRPEVPCTIDGRPVIALEGDTVLTALLLHGRRVRRFEFDATGRAGYCLMGACQDCWVRTADGCLLRACTTPVLPGMAILTERQGND